MTGTGPLAQDPLPGIVPITALWPRDARTACSTQVFAAMMGQRMADARQDLSAQDSALAVLREYGVGVPDHGTATLQGIALEIDRSIMDDPVHDNEASMAVRACRGVLIGHWGEALRITGWVPEDPHTVEGITGVLTGDPCPQCGINPVLEIGPLSWICFDTTGCGWGEDVAPL